MNSRYKGIIILIVILIGLVIFIILTNPRGTNIPNLKSYMTGYSIVSFLQTPIYREQDFNVEFDRDNQVLDVSSQVLMPDELKAQFQKWFEQKVETKLFFYPIKFRAADEFLPSDVLKR